MNNEHYKPTLDNVAKNSHYQGIDFSLSRDKQEATLYPVEDKLQNATINDDFIYLSATDRQHECYINGKLARSDDFTAFSGYFTSQATAENRIDTDGFFDSYTYHRDLCVAPTVYATDKGILMDKRHLDCFYIDRDRMEQIYGTRDFNAAIGKCNANNHFGSDGGDQGYNSALTELYNNGCLKYAGTHDAAPGSEINCQAEYQYMLNFQKEKCKAIISRQSSENIQSIGYKLDLRCHEKTSFNNISYPDASVFAQNYVNYKNTYNDEIANTTTAKDRMTSQMWEQLKNSTSSAQSSTSDETAGTLPPDLHEVSDSAEAGTLPKTEQPLTPDSLAPQTNISSDLLTSVSKDVGYGV